MLFEWKCQDQFLNFLIFDSGTAEVGDSRDWLVTKEWWHQWDISDINLCTSPVGKVNITKWNREISEERPCNGYTSDGNACQDTFIGSKSLSVNKSRVLSVKKVPQILMKFHHIESTTPFHLRNWSWFALERVEIWDPKRTQLCHQSEALGRYHRFRPSRAAQSHWTGTHFHVSRCRGWMVFLQGWKSWEVTLMFADGSDDIRCF